MPKPSVRWAKSDTTERDAPRWLVRSAVPVPLLALLLGATALTPVAAQSASSLQTLGYLPGGSSSDGNAINADGMVVVGPSFNAAANQSEAF